MTTTTHTPDDPAPIIGLLHAMGRADLAHALTVERLTMVRMIAEIAGHRRRLFDALDDVRNGGYVDTPALAILIDELVDELRPLLQGWDPRS